MVDWKVRLRLLLPGGQLARRLADLGGDRLFAPVFDEDEVLGVGVIGFVGGILGGLFQRFVLVSAEVVGLLVFLRYHLRYFWGNLVLDQGGTPLWVGEVLFLAHLLLEDLLFVGRRFWGVWLRALGGIKLFWFLWLLRRLQKLLGLIEGFVDVEVEIVDLRGLLLGILSFWLEIFEFEGPAVRVGFVGDGLH